MSVSTDAILFYGVLLKEEHVEKVVEKFFGGEPEDETGTFLDIWDEHHVPGVELVMHCSGSCTEYAIALDGTVTIAARGYPQEISLAKLIAPDAPNGIDPIAEQLKIMGFPKSVIRWAGQNTKWWMVSWWEE